MKITIGYLYGDLMNIYGDTGNIIALKKRAQWRGIEASVKNISVGDKLKKGEIDIFFFGGGQDQQQIKVAYDLIKSAKGDIIKSDIEKGVPLLSVCGGYQLLGEYYAPFDKPKLPGVNLFPVFTKASHDRMIGNLIVNSSSLFNDKQYTSFLVGFENHSGKTYLKEDATALGQVIKGFGNNGEDETEGCIYKNAIGCYMHGSLLPKNPEFADWLLEKALEVKYGKSMELKPLDDSLELKAHNRMVRALTNKKL